ncbi:hypothetical protein CCACVL1_11575 [Corchorus capsularis]|uniref:CDC20/Fizzy WD40 domain-containing protein n=1 Tax=Corchorus capsularis TaxID=210143 RepID=A0A1R3IKG1_COCAP|nr:hypothetical protein CCACVL1_11575 [Corchorus capsularis]
MVAAITSKTMGVSKLLQGAIRNSKRKRTWHMDRFIPVRSAMDFDYAHGMLTERKSIKDTEKAAISPASEAYRKVLAEALGMNRTRILAFIDNKPSKPLQLFPWDLEFHRPAKIAKPTRVRDIPQSPVTTLDAIGMADEFAMNLLDWGSSDLLALGLENRVYLYDHYDFHDIGNEDAQNQITSVSWAPDGRRIAFGLDNSEVQLWDVTSDRKLRTLKGHDISSVGSMAWNNDHILTTGGMNGRIKNNDVRIRSQTVQEYRGHRQEICGLNWSASGQRLASGGNDKLVHIWDKSMASSNSPTQWLHRLDQHTSAVKALSWCPFQSNLLASGGGKGDGSIKFWSSETGACLNSMNTGSEVCALLWSKTERELLSSHGDDENKLILWRYPSMVNMGEMRGHSCRALYVVQSPDDGCTVASAAGDETLRFWKVFGDPEIPKPAPKLTAPFPHVNRIR